MIAALLLVGLATRPAAAADEERVMGASLTEDAPPMETIFPMLMGLPLAQSEIDLFLDHFGAVETWAQAHPADWKAVNEADDPLKATLALPLWGEAGITGPEFFTLFVKLQTAHKIASGALSAENLKEQSETYTMLSQSEELDAASRAEAKLRLHLHQAMLAALTDYPPENLELYAANKDKLLAVFARFASLGDVPEPPADTPPTEPAPAEPAAD